MAYVTTYQLTWNAVDKDAAGASLAPVLCTLNVSDTESAVGTPVFIPLVAQKCEIKVVNDSDDKFSIIKGKRIEFSFVSTSLYNISTFVSGSDRRYLCELFVDTTLVFTGFLVTDAMQEAFLPRTTFVVELVASDNIGLLKDEPLTKPDGTNPRGYFRLIDFVSWCLQKTGLQLPINMAYNLKPESLVLADHAFDKVYLWSKSIEQDINISEDCYTVLTKILKGCFLTQEKGEWWIVRVDEMNGSDLRVYNYTYDGTLTGNSLITFSKNIGRTEVIKLIKKDAFVAPERPKKEVKTIFGFQFPLEIIDNIDFNRGTVANLLLVPDISLYIKSYANLGAFPAQGEFNTTYKANDTSLYYKWSGASYVNITGAEIPQGFNYDIDDWVLEKSGGGSPTITAQVVKIKQFGDEKARYVELKAGTGFHWIKSNRVPLGRYDKFVFSVDRRLTQNVTGTGTTQEFVAQIRLYGEDGTFWSVENIASGSIHAGQWVQSGSSSFTAGRFVRVFFIRNDVDETQWMNVSVDTDPIPVNGEIEILLVQQTVHGTSIGTHFSNLNFEYIPYINGSYQKYTSQQHKVSQVLNTKAVQEEKVPMADGPKKLFKMVLHEKTAGGKYFLSENWYNGNAGTGGELGIAKFGKYQAFEFWNQSRRIIRKFDATLLGLNINTPTDIPGLLHNYIFTAATEHSTDKTYLLLSYSQDLISLEWSGVFAEVFDSNEGKVYNSTHDFKYISDHE